MAPIYDSDVSEKRYETEAWENVELWEKIEARNRRRRRFWIFATILSAAIITAIPVFWDQSPHWAAKFAARQLATEIMRFKTIVARTKKPHLFTFTQPDALEFSISEVGSCGNPPGIVNPPVQKLEGGDKGELTVLSPEQAKDILGVDHIVQSVCYDPVQGFWTTEGGAELRAFAIGPIPDLDPQKKRSNRIVLILISGKNGEISYE